MVKEKKTNTHRKERRGSPGGNVTVKELKRGAGEWGKKPLERKQCLIHY